MKQLVELINQSEPGIQLVREWMADAVNHVEVLPRDIDRAGRALFEAQVTTRSPMGAIVYETGGLLIDHGWIRVLGSGHARLNRELMEWNKGKSFTKAGEKPSFLLVADDVLGGFFAINGGGIGRDDIGLIFYFAQDDLRWHETGFSYSDFLTFCFSGDLQQYYEGLRWTGWESEIQGLSGDKGLMCYPFLWTEQGKNINEVHRGEVPVSELWFLSQDFKRQLDGGGQ